MKVTVGFSSLDYLQSLSEFYLPPFKSKFHKSLVVFYKIVKLKTAYFLYTIFLCT